MYPRMTLNESMNMRELTFANIRMPLRMPNPNADKPERFA